MQNFRYSVLNTGALKRRRIETIRPILPILIVLQTLPAPKYVQIYSDVYISACKDFTE